MDVDLVVHGGTVVNADWMGEATVLVSNGKVVGLVDSTRSLASLALGADVGVVDASDALVIPGGIDPHAHPAVKLGPFPARDDYSEASVAALWGGTTTLIDFAFPARGESPVHAVQEHRRLSRQARCDVAMHGCVVEPSRTLAEDLVWLADNGAPTTKVFTTYKGEFMIDPATLDDIFRIAARLGTLTYVHAESDSVIEDEVARHVSEGHTSSQFHPTARPSSAEVEAVRDVLGMMRRHQEAKAYFVHQTTPEAVDLVRAARAQGMDVYSEACMHYLVLSDECYARDDGELFVCCPPLRSRDEVDGLRDRLRWGSFDAVGSDHCCFDRAQKAQNASDFRNMPYGLPGVETRLPLLFSEFVATRTISTQEFVRLISTSPARLNGLFPRKGIIAPGADADIVIFAPGDRRTIRSSELHMRSDYSPFDGMAVTGWPRTVIVGGRVVIDGGEFHDPGPTNRNLMAFGPLGRQVSRDGAAVTAVR